MSNAHISSMTKRLCGHIDMYSFSSKGRSGRRSDTLYATATVCGECRARLGRLVEHPDTGFFPVALPALAGRENAVSWAKDIRLKTLRKLGPVMAQLKKSQDPLATAAFAAYEMLFKIPTALFWIENRELPFDSAWVVFEVEHLMRTRPTSTVRLSGSSAFVYWSQADCSVIAAAKVAASAVIGIDVVPEAQTVFETQPPSPPSTSQSIFL
ncbi:MULTISPECIES: hypothetical protein [Pseudomonas]|uniref:Uncharacterized protein n=2 Tax=Pseudomonas TaxID=286 RepID=A0A7X1GHU9_9PSED|nr:MULTISPECIES: hypothetical protein [Pseudomonas]MBC2692676.1 hypothetical protein [Pseudomonas kielensis]MDD1008393.1 hypothetical protein [Pseudomonas shahriarae]